MSDTNSQILTPEIKMNVIFLHAVKATTCPLHYTVLTNIAATGMKMKHNSLNNAGLETPSNGLLISLESLVSSSEGIIGVLVIHPLMSTRIISV